MSIIGVRIDGRLIHGQVANLWATKLNISRIMVVDDEVAGNAIEKWLKISNTSWRETKRYQLKSCSKYFSRKIRLTTFTNCGTETRSFIKTSRTLPIKEINVGNMSQTNETRSITKSINVVDQDIDVFKELNAKGVHLIAQMVPSDKAEDFMSLITK